MKLKLYLWCLAALIGVLILFVYSCQEDDSTTPEEIQNSTELGSKNTNDKKIDICHYDAKKDRWFILNINENAFLEHCEHGDKLLLVDADGDGFYEGRNECVPDGDCDDTNPDIYPGPGATENCLEYESILINTTWDFLVTYSETTFWHADVTFYADGTTRYDEPEYPGIYLSFGYWSVVGNELTYRMDLSCWLGNYDAYLFTGEIIGNTMSGTYTWGERNPPPTWTATKYP